MAVSTDPQPFSNLIPAQQEGILELTAEELMCLLDRVKNSEAGTFDMPLQSAYPLKLKLGSAFVAMVSDSAKEPGTIAVAVTEAEAWVLQGVVSVFDKTTDPLFGTKLVRKIMLLLLSLNGLNERFNVVDEESSQDMSKEKVKEILSGKPPAPKDTGEYYDFD